MIDTWRPQADREPDASVLAVAVEHGSPRYLRWERAGAGWVSRGACAAYSRLSPPRPWSEIGRKHVDGHFQTCPVVDITAELPEQCPACAGYGCFECGWDGRLWVAAASDGRTPVVAEVRFREER